MTFSTPKTAYKHKVLEDQRCGQATPEDFHVTPHMTIQWLRYARYVWLCAPLELRDNHDIKDLVIFVRKLLARETSLEKEFIGYRYTRHDWLKDVAD